MRIHRYELPIEAGDPILDIPMGFKPLAVAPSRTHPDEIIDIWIQVPEVAPLIPVQFIIVGTGHLLPPVLQSTRLSEFVGTVVCPNGLVWHTFATVPAGVTS